MTRNALREVFHRCNQVEKRTAFIGFVTAGYPTRADCVDVLLAMERGGCDVIELGVPFTDPLADGPVIQASSQVALRQGVDITQCLEFVKNARARGLQCPVVLMGYFNPFHQFGSQRLMSECVQVGVSGFIVVDLPPEEAGDFIISCKQHSLSFIPLISPTSTKQRMQSLCSTADSFIYIVSSMGVTGQKIRVDDSVDQHKSNSVLTELVGRVRQCSSLPLAVGFGVSDRQDFCRVAECADGVVIGSKFISTIDQAVADKSKSVADAVQSFAMQVCGHAERSLLSSPETQWHSATVINQESTSVLSDQMQSSKFGEYGGQFAPETLMFALQELEQEYLRAKDDPAFWAEFESYYDFIGRPSKLQLAQRLTDHCGGARIWLKREDLNHTGSHKINNALGQILLAKRLGKARIIAETGAGQHGVATATVCAHFNYPCDIYMGHTDTIRQSLNVFRIGLLGSKVVPVMSGQATLKDAINEAMRDWVKNVQDTHYLVGSAIGPHPFPSIVRTFQSVIGEETKKQMMVQAGKMPDMVVACVGGGSNAIGMFHPFKNVKSADGSLVELVGVEAGGEGVETGKHSATLSAGVPGVLHGCKTYLLQDEKGQITETHSISAGLDYPGVGPEHAHLKDSMRARYVAVTDKQSLEGFLALSQLEGIIPALETAHAVHYAMEVASSMPKDSDIVICVSGRGDKDVQQVRDLLSSYNLSTEKKK